MDPKQAAAAATRAVEEPDAPARAPAEPDLEDSSLYFNRELSWLDFNDRVLQLAEDSSTGLLERVKFGAIWESNLDEFFMVRVANLHDQLEAGVDVRGADGMSPNDQVNAIRDVVLAQRERLTRCVERELRPALAEHGIRIISPQRANAAEGEQLERVFEQSIFPALTPLAIGLGRPFPYISNLSLSLAVTLRDPDQDTEVLARVKVPKELLGRFVKIGDGGATLVPLEDLIAANLGSLFPGMEVTDHSFFRVTRDTDYDVSDEADDLLQAVEEELRRRRFGEVVRLEVDQSMSPKLREQLRDALSIDERQLYETEGLLDLSDLWDVVGVRGFSELRDLPHTPVTQPRLLGEDGADADVFGAIREADILVHHPYDSFATSFEAFLLTAARDPDVVGVKTTLYRTSDDSPVVPALIEATERGKQSVALIELKARFDERRNIGWSRSLEQAGVHVVYGFPNLKIHAKTTLIVRREGDELHRYVHLGTGNYNVITAQGYEDYGLFTADPEIAADVADLFNHLTGFGRPQRFRKILVAPYGLREAIVERIRTVARAAGAGKDARIRIKVNNLNDEQIINELYAASAAGARIDIIARSICTLRPGVPGLSEGIRVRSILGRFLEHSRMFVFDADGKSEFFLGSADLMPRNLDHRIELVAPVQDGRAQQEIMRAFDVWLADNATAWELSSEGRWMKLRPKKGDRGKPSQGVFMRSARARAARHAANLRRSR